VVQHTIMEFSIRRAQVSVCTCRKIAFPRFIWLMTAPLQENSLEGVMAETDYSGSTGRIGGALHRAATSRRPMRWSCTPTAEAGGTMQDSHLDQCVPKMF